MGARHVHETEGRCFIADFLQASAASILPLLLPSNFSSRRTRWTARLAAERSTFSLRATSDYFFSVCSTAFSSSSYCLIVSSLLL
jgi:hypothetical protein